MRVFHELRDVAEITSATSVAIGNFDGVHLGHQALIHSMLSRAQQSGLCPTVLTFFPHPVEVLKPHKKLERLTTTSEKLELFERLGVEQVLVARFDTSLSQMTPEVFFETFLSSGLKAQSLHVGFNFCFGREKSGNIETLRKLSDQNKIYLKVEEQINEDGERVSSSGIRSTLAAGDVAHAAKLLGRPYQITGQVQKGDQRGRALGFPTANLRCPHDKITPKNGVYLTHVRWQQETLRAVTNVGVRPTFTQSAPNPIIEVHLLNFDAMIYDEFLTVEFVKRIRDEKKFSSIDELKAQIALDVQMASL